REPPVMLLAGPQVHPLGNHHQQRQPDPHRGEHHVERQRHPHLRPGSGHDIHRVTTLYIWCRSGAISAANRNQELALRISLVSWPAKPQFSNSTSSMTIWVRSGFLPSTSTRV